eukprot:210787_1
MSDAPIICKSFGSAVGCRFGNKCRFNHNNPNAIPLCKYYRSPHGCIAGNTCHWRHHFSGTIANNNYNHLSIDDDINIPICNNGVSCRFRHIKEETKSKDKTAEVIELFNILKSWYERQNAKNGIAHLDDSTFAPIRNYMENTSFVSGAQSLYFQMELCDFLMKSKRVLRYSQDYLINKWYFQLSEHIHGSSKKIDEYVVFGFISEFCQSKIPPEIKQVCSAFYHQNDYFKFVGHGSTERSKNKKVIHSNNDEFEMSFGKLLFGSDSDEVKDINEQCWQFKIIFGSKENIVIGLQPFETCEESMVPETGYSSYGDSSCVLCNDGFIDNPYHRKQYDATMINDELSFAEGDIVCMSFKVKEGMLGFYVIKHDQDCSAKTLKYNYLFTNLADKKYRMVVGLNSGSVQLI